VTDLQLRQHVLDELEFEPSIDAAHIGVSVEKGVVTLTGHVASFAERAAAEGAVRRVKGVKAIAEDIEVRFPFEKHTADDEIAARGVKILAWTTGLPEGRVEVKVEQGWVTLAGEVEHQYQKSAAATAIGRLSGVRGVSNLIEIKSRPFVSETERRIEAALRRVMGDDAEDIQIKLQGTRVILEGEVRTWHQRDKAEWAAWAAPGVTAVEDRLQIA
jgi:osmotically-inducible protein OsmY